MVRVSRKHSKRKYFNQISLPASAASHSDCVSDFRSYGRSSQNTVALFRSRAARAKHVSKFNFLNHDLMENIVIIVIEDQREVLRAIGKDLVVLEGGFLVEECESTAEARQVMDAIDAAGDHIALIISDQVMPNQNGVDFLIEVHDDNRFTGTRKMLLTGLATHRDTIEAINKASIDKYISKPWKTDELIDSVKTLVTEFILEKGIDYARYLDLLDKQVLFDNLRKTT